ncbi:VC0807 family protein [Streptomyces mexicanus]|uniref:VC0807 family protein n=1 Tax=Streptomyces mexicanus TaxID=178566 RepID=UPI0031EF7194
MDITAHGVSTQDVDTRHITTPGTTTPETVIARGTATRASGDQGAPRGPGPRAVRRSARLSLVLDLGLSPGVFYGAQALGAGITPSLVAATVAAGARLAWTTARARRLDGLNALMMGSYGLMLLTALLAHDERVLLARDPATSALAGLVFLASCATGTPALAFLSRRLHPRAATGTERTQKMFRTETLVWGVALTVEAAARFVVVFTLPLRTAPGVSTTAELVVVAALVPWTIRHRRRHAPTVPRPGDAHRGGGTA